ncbi:tRNA methyltransferase-like protein [Leptotrombidium deliense]|uniref:tRNA methyltransferase-like protein n=1 Tax=Leptotrombidium deliense TaxID=299467 RepID=A0A443SF26_9ACAR|nr:tRNA methyltransferase-like protein [Leptotrombidium deliense]
MKVMNEENEINCNYSSELNESPKKQYQNQQQQQQEQLSEMMTAASRCLALEQAYVHDVYSEIARECGACSPVRSHIKQFLFDEFEFGSLLMDIGCGDCKYLNLNADIFTVGLERCEDWFHKEENVIRNNSSNCCNDLLIADLVYLPIRDEFFDGVLCCGVLHHLSTTERRIRALNEMCRIMKIGGKLMITVWAFEGREVNCH